MNASTSFEHRFNILLGRLFLVLGIALIPSVFNAVFAISPLLEKETQIVINLAIAVGVAGLLIILFRSRLKPTIGTILFGVLSLMYLELGFRLAAVLFMNPGSMRQLEIAQLQTYNEYSAFMGHPFMGYTRRPNVVLDGSEEIPPIYYYNKYGFNGLEVDYAKPEGTIRIAALGGSTTARGYPEQMQAYLDSAFTQKNVEVLNFGISGWSSAHTMVNYLMNVVEFDPDYIVVHQGWNEEGVRNVPQENFRPDYSHVYSYYKEPIIWDRYLMRTSLIYRYIISKLDRTPPWAYLEQSTTLTKRERTELNYSNSDELEPFKRNTKTIIDHARINGIRVVLTTLPHSTDETAGHFYAAPNIDQCNEIMRALKSEEILFVDLDTLITGKNDLFIDLGHLSEEGRNLKAREIGQAIFAHYKGQNLR